MEILVRYLIRAHVGPFLFALTALTGMVYLNAMAQRLEDIMGKGLPLSTILEFMALTLPHTIALTLPMAVLVAVLYAFSDLTAQNEITAMSGGGVNPIRALMPLVGVGVILAGVMYFFNERILPEANHSLKNLLVDIGGKRPTFDLREQVVNSITTVTQGGRGQYYLQAVEIEPTTSELRDVTIYDLSDPSRHRTTYAVHGTMAFNESRTDLYLTLYDGVSYEVARDRDGGFQVIRFEEQVVPLKGVDDILSRTTGTTYRTDREMSSEMLGWEVTARLQELTVVQEDTYVRARDAVRVALGLPPVEPGVPEDMNTISGARQAPSPVRFATTQILPPDGISSAALMTTRSNASRGEMLRNSANRYGVEIHKKYAIAFACIVFVLIGAPLAIRFPRGGVGMVIVTSMAVFSLYYVCLISGEALADRGYMHPALAMWAPNSLFLFVGVYLVRGMAREVATARGGGWDDLIFTLHQGIRRPLARLRPGTST
ncbi:LptF/LptG family permease [Gemmatimonadota bacterium]